MMILDHSFYIQILKTNSIIVINKIVSNLMQEIISSINYFLVC